MSELCEHALGALSDYVDGELDRELCAELERHLTECGNCRIVVDTLRRTIILYRDYGHEAVPQDAKSRLYAVVKVEQERRAAS
jgi:anti-sigma factor RsiW